MKIHRWLDFKVTRRCSNAHRTCTYCSVPVDSPKAAELLSLDTIQRTLLDARRLGFDVFWFLGGEPSLRQDAPELFDPLAHDPTLILTVVTNGQQENWPMVQALYRTRARRSCVQVSLDTLSPENHKHAPPGQLLTYVARLREMADRYSRPDHHCEVEIHTVITRENHTEFDEFVRFFAARKVPVSLAMVCPWQVADHPVSFNEFTLEELRSICRRIDKLRTGLGTDAFNPLVAQFVRRFTERSPAQPRSCGAGLTHLVVNADGSVHRCMAESFEPATSLGNIRTERLHQVLRQVRQPARCPERPDCFDGYAWDRLTLEPSTERERPS